MEEKFQKGKQKILNSFDFPKDISMELPKIIVIGNKEITIENHKGLIVFENNIVKIGSRIGAITISGSNFEILFIGDSTITISGVFYGISYEG